MDFLWPEQKVVAEVDGYGFHSGARAFERDRERDAALAATGYGCCASPGGNSPCAGKRWPPGSPRHYPSARDANRSRLAQPNRGAGSITELAQGLSMRLVRRRASRQVSSPAAAQDPLFACRV